MARGFTWVRYVDDNGGEWALAIDSDYVGHTERGWTVIATNELYPLPRSWRPRRVVGLDTSGRVQSAVVGTLACDLWSGVSPTFVIRDSEGAPQTCTVTRYEQEKRPVPRADEDQPQSRP